MSYVEIEVRAKTVDLAVEAAMQELDVTDREQLAIEVIQQPEKGFLGLGVQDAVVRVKRRKSRRRRNERKRESRGQGQDRGSKQQKAPTSAKNGGGNQRVQQSQSKGRHMSQQGEKREPKIDDRPDITIEEQARIATQFLEGLVDAFGLEGTVTTKIED